MGEQQSVDEKGPPPGRHRAALLQLFVSPTIVRGGLKVALVVGTVLNILNNGEQLWTRHEVVLWRVAMNYLVPYCVSTYSAARIELMRIRGE
ncbi:MAG: nitrate/nitrite transporter NrtS [Burkholderiales bacterium]|nr:nitrate/nitrite transporter NrtS [Burkholderiales bacterium]